jgi:hypothetical protein
VTPNPGPAGNFSLSFTARKAQGYDLEITGGKAANTKILHHIEFMPGAVLAIAREVLAGHVAAARRDMKSAVARLEDAARLEAALTYGEPPEWTVPVRQELGMVMLAAGRAADAERVFREDLKRFPDNGWSLRGLELALRARGRAAEADEVKAQASSAWATADVDLPSPAPRN